MNGQGKLLDAEREQLIIDRLRRQKVLSVSELGDVLKVSPATVRRDLQQMHEKGLLRRIRGGATLDHDQHSEPLFQDKQDLRREAKESIAWSALALVKDNDRIYLDGGSTVLMLARLLDQRQGLTIVTNSLVAGAELMNSSHRLIIVGGEFRRLSRTLVGPLSAPVINSLHVDKAFMGTIGFTAEDGMSTTEASEAFTKECVMRRADQVILLADSSKLGVASFARSGSLAEIDLLITDHIDEPVRAELENNGVAVKTATE